MSDDVRTVRVYGGQLWCARCDRVKVRGRSCPACGTHVPLGALSDGETRRAALKAAGWRRRARGPAHDETWVHPDHHTYPVAFATAWRRYRATHGHGAV